MSVCTICGHRTRDKYNLERHARTHVLSEFSCFYCDLKFKSKNLLTRHMEKCSGSDAQPTYHQCPLCSSKFFNRELIEAHLCHAHKLKLETQVFTFANEDDFRKWKSEEEKSSAASFAAKSGFKNRSGEKTMYFKCSRSGSSVVKPQDIRKNQPYLLGSPKIGVYCPARMSAKTSKEGEVEVTYWCTHVGHDCDVSRLRLSKEYRQYLADKMKMKIPLSKILADERENGLEASAGKLRRSLLLTMTDLYNIARDFGIRRDAVSKRNYSISLSAWIERNEASDSPWVLYSKLNGSTDPLHAELLPDDSVLILMTDTQLQMLQKFGTDVICVDGTHGTNKYGLDMTTVLILNDQKEGFPVATMFSSRSDSEMMTFFFNVIRDVSGQINCQIFMSDLSDIYFQAWNSVMGIPGCHLFCSWHVDRAWRSNLNKVKGSQEIKDLIYHNLITVRMECDIASFQSLFDELTDDLLQNDATQEFGRYIRDHFAWNVPNWAYCYRLQAGIDTNTYLERMHCIFLYFYLKGKKTERIDDAILALETFIKSKLVDDVISFQSGRHSIKSQNLRRKHVLYRKQSANMQVRQTQSNGWLVSSTKTHDTHTVTKVLESCLTCSLRCSWCQVCAHSFVCTCLDNVIGGNMCKHIHKVCSEPAPPLNASNDNSSDSAVIIEEPTCDLIFVEEPDRTGKLVDAAVLELLSPPSDENTIEDDIQNVGQEFLEMLRRTVTTNKHLDIARKAIAELEATILE